MPQLNDDGEVRAAGGVVVRTGDDGRPCVLIVHRPKYDDWSLPKGKADKGETDEECARREVEEETGFYCELREELPTARYIDRLGRPKVARYWRMRVIGGSFAPTEEVDRVAWVAIDEARKLLSYERDADVVESLR